MIQFQMNTLSGCYMLTSQVKKRKSQMEIMGLMIIVVLIALAMLFVITFLSTQDPSNIKKNYISKELAEKTGTALLKTTTDCKGQDLKQLLQDCSTGPTILCENGQSSCTYAYKVIDQITTNSLIKWNRAFNFTVTQGDNLQYQKLNGNCAKTDLKPFIQPLPGDMIIKLDICG